MFDTYVAIVGTAMTTPEKRATANTNTLVASFRVAAHPRRFDQKTGTWADSPGLRIRVNCWRRLADHASESIKTGDPVFVYGRISTRDWKTDEGEARTNYEVDAVCVGHDLGRGVSTFVKAKQEIFGRVADDAEADGRVNGELTYALPLVGSAESAVDDYSGPPSDDDAIAILRAAGIDAAGIDASAAEGEEELDEEEPTSAVDGSGGSDGRSRRRGRQPVPA